MDCNKAYFFHIFKLFQSGGHKKCALSCCLLGCNTTVSGRQSEVLEELSATVFYK